MLTAFADDIWIAQGGTLSVLGFTYPTRCAVIRLAQGELVIWSPTTLDDALKAQVDALGRVAYLIAPNARHHLFVAQWQAAYPEARLYGLAALHSKRPDLRFDGILDDTPPLAWADQMDQIVLHNKITDEIVFFHHASKTVIFTDVIQQFPTGWHSGWRALVAKLDLMVGETPNVPRKFRLGFGNRAKARAAVARILQWPIERVIMAHGQPVTSGGKAVLENTFRWLIR